MPRYTNRKRYTRKPFRRTTVPRRPVYKRKPYASRRRTKGKSGSSYSITTTRQKGYLPFGQSYYCKLPYSTCINISASGALTTTWTHQYRMNSLYDPDQTGIGHQPYQYDQLSPMYLRYIVYGCSYTVTFSNPTIDGIWVGVNIRNDADTPKSAAGKTIDFLREVKLGQISPLNNSGSQVKTFKGYIACHSVFGVTRAQYAAEPVTYGATSTTNPPATVIIEPFMADINGNNGTVSMDLKLTYYSVLSAYVTPVQS